MAKHAEAEGGWSARHYLTCASLFAASACGMFGCGPGTMSLAFYGMGKDKTLGFSAATISSLLALGSAGFSIGKLFGGPLSDRLGGKRSLCLILSIMGACQVLMSRRSGLRVLAVAWFVTRAVHAAMWCGVMLVARPWFMTNNLSAALSLLTASCPTGAFSGALFGGRLLATRGWRGVAWHTGVLTLATGAFVQLAVSHSPPATVSITGALVPERVAAATNAPQNTQPGRKPPRSQREASVASAKPRSPSGLRKGGARHRTRLEAVPVRRAAAIVLRDPKIWAVYSCSALITPTLDLPTLLPLYLDSIGVDPLRIGWLGSMFSLAAVPAVLGGGWLHQRLDYTQRKFFYVPLLCLAACGLQALSTVQGHAPHSAAARILLPSALVAIMGGMSPSFYIPTYDYVMRFGGCYTGTLTGLCDFFGGVMCTLCYSFYPRLLRRGGWASVFRVYAAMNVASAVAIAVFCTLEERNPLRSSPLDSSESDGDGDDDGEHSEALQPQPVYPEPPEEKAEVREEPEEPKQPEEKREEREEEEEEQQEKEQQQEAEAEGEER